MAINKINSVIKKSIRYLHLNIPLHHLSQWLGYMVRKVKLTDKKLYNEYLSYAEERKLHIGCGSNLIKGWLNTDYYPIKKDILHLDATKKFPFEDNSFQYIYTEHMIEHIAYDDALAMLQECYRKLDVGGRIRVATPNISFLISLYRDKNELNTSYIKWSFDKYICGKEIKSCEATTIINNYVRNWGHQFIHSKTTLQDLMLKAGFTNVAEFAPNESSSNLLCNLENVARMPKEYYELETMIFEAEK